MKPYYIVLLLCLAFAGCDSFTETDLPITQLNSEYVFEDRTTANAAMADVYARIRDNGLLNGGTNGLSHLGGLYTDEMNYYGTLAAPTAYYNNAVIPLTTNVSTWWNQGYRQIYAANSVREGVLASQGIEAADKAQLEGEALFVRALVHFYLTQTFGDIPYIKTTDYRENSTVSRSTQAQVYTAVIEDLEQAVSLLGEDYLDAERIRPNRYAAHALLARAYLYNGQWAEAANEASAVLNNTGLYVWQTDLNSVFLKESTTAIWQLKPKVEGENTNEGATFIFLQGPPSRSALTEELIAAFEPGDQRLALWTKAVTNGTNTWYHANKYKERAVTGSSLEYSIVLRLAEQYLIRAEARARQGELIGAKEDLDMIRTTAGLSPTTANTQDALLSAILQEYRVEFFTEYGHRWFSLKRFGLLDSALSGKPGWDAHERVLPLPERELGLNPNLAPQNSGY